jgi:glycerol-3-phosphate acyltransferase PlsY
LLSILTSALLGYLLGSIPFGYLLVRLFRGADVRTTGSGNIGATNVARTSPVLGIATLLLDALKGFAAVAAAMWISRPEVILWIDSNAPNFPEHAWTPLLPIVLVRAAVAATFAILGHMFPLWLKFRGGKGVATALGAFLALAPRATFATALVFLLVAFLTRYISLSSITAAALFPILVWKLDGSFSPVALTLICISSVLIIGRHHENIRRLLSHTEPKFGSKSK